MLDFKILFASASILLVMIIIMQAVLPSPPPPKPAFAQCLTDAGYQLAGSNNCISCSRQKALFGDTFQYIDFHNCNVDRQWCMDHGVQVFPTWLLPEGRVLPGLQPLERLSELSGCETGINASQTD